MDLPPPVKKNTFCTVFLVSNVSVNTYAVLADSAILYFAILPSFLSSLTPCTFFFYSLCWRINLSKLSGSKIFVTKSFQSWMVTFCSAPPTVSLLPNWKFSQQIDRAINKLVDSLTTLSNFLPFWIEFFGDFYFVCSFKITFSSFFWLCD